MNAKHLFNTLFTRVMAAVLLTALLFAALPVMGIEARPLAAPALTWVGNIGSAQSKTAGTTLAITTTAAVAAGDDIIVAVAMDETGGNPGVTDSVGNTYVEIADEAIK